MTPSASSENVIGQPSSAEEYYELGKVLSRQDKTDEAIAAYERAIELEPNLAIVHNNLGNMLLRQQKYSEAAAVYERAIELEPQLAIAHCNLGNILAYQGKREAAIAAYEQAILHQPDYHPAKFGLTMAQLAIIYADESEVEAKRQNYQTHLEDLAIYYRDADLEERVSAAGTVGSHQTFGLAYQGKNDVELQRTYGSMMHQLMVSRYPQWCKPLNRRQIVPGQKIRLGFVSGFFHHHSVWKIPLQGWLENIDRSEFELFGYYTGSIRDRQTARAAKTFDRFEHHHYDLEQWAAKIASDELDVLIFPEFGMNSMTIKLGCLRLAPVQMTSWGHPNTSGLPTIDYYLSSDLMESENAGDYYSEKLVRLPNLGICYQPIAIRPKPVSKVDLGIKDDEIMYWCCQSLFKYLPQHDDVFPRIALELKQAKFVFIELTSELVTNVFRQRLATAFEQFALDYRDYCIFLPRLKAESFVGTTAIADVFLDNIGWSGCNTTLESIPHGVPIVTLPGQFMRGRHTSAILNMLGVEATIAKDKAEYIQIAIRLGQDADYRRDIARQIAQNKDKIYGDLSPVRALENFLFEVVDKPRNVADARVNQAFQAGLESQQANQLAAARQHYLQVIADRPQHVEALSRLGIIAQQTNQLDEAEHYLSTAVAIQPASLPAWFSLGNLRQSRGQYPSAEAAYRQALKLRPDSVAICNNLGYVLQEQGNFEAAASFYQQALDLDPKCVAAEVNWKNALYAQGKLTAEQQIKYAKLNFKLGLGRQRSQDWQTAIAYYRQAVLMDDNLAEAHFHLGMALQEQREFPEAITCYQRVLELDAECGAAYYSLGQIHQDLGDLDRAVTNFKQGLKLINPNYAKAVESSAENTAIFADNYDVPAIPQGEVTVGDYQFPAIPAVSNSENRPFWSIVIPVVNRPEYFPECLASVLAQWTNSEEMEIIVLDNGSQPAQWKIPDELGRGIVRYCRFSETIPLQENWNAAVSLCRGQWIHLLHHDDYVLPGFYARFTAGLKDCPESVGAAFTGYENINETRDVIFSQEYNLGNHRGIVVDWLLHLGISSPLSPPSLVIRRTAYERLGGYKLDLLYTCDWEFYKRVAAFYDWWYEPGISAHYREQAQSITVAENINGSSGAAHRRAIEISYSYLPVEHRESITAKSLAFHFGWCLRRALIPLKADNFEGTLCLLKEALKMNSSPEAVSSLSGWLQKERAASLVNHLTSLEAISEEEHILADLARKIVSGQIQSPELVEALQLAMQHQRKNAFAKAEQIYRQILQQQPKQPDALYGLSILAQHAGQNQDAEQFLETALQSRPKFFQAWLSIGNLYQSQERLDDAALAYQRAIDLKPDVFVTYNNLGYVLEQQGNQDRAIVCYQKAIKIQPNCHEAKASLGNILFARQQLSPEQQIHYAVLNNDLGFNCQSKNNLDTAIAYYRQAIALQPESAIAHYNLGTALELKGAALEEFRSCYQRVVELQSDNPTAFSQSASYKLKKIDRQFPSSEKTNVRRKSKLAFISQPFVMTNFRQPMDSIGIITYELAQRLALEFDVTVYGASDRAREDEHEGIVYRYISVAEDLQLLAEGEHSDSDTPVFASDTYYQNYINTVANDIRDRGFDIVHVHNLSQFIPIVRAVNPDLKLVLHMHCDWLNDLDYSMLSERLQAADLIISPSQFITKAIQQRFEQYASRCKTLFNGVNIHRYLNGYVNRADLKSDRQQSVKRLLYVGRICPAKGSHVLLAAFKEVLKQRTDVELTMVGPVGVIDSQFIVSLAEDPQLQPLLPFHAGGGSAWIDYLKASLSELNSQQENKASVLLPGLVSPNRLAEYYHQADIFIFPSVWHEAFGMPVAEAMIAGAPVITTHAGALGELVEDGESGLVVARNNTDRLTEAILRLLDDEKLSSSLSKAGQKRAVELFSFARIADELSGHYQNLLQLESSRIE